MPLSTVALYRLRSVRHLRYRVHSEYITTPPEPSLDTNTPIIIQWSYKQTHANCKSNDMISKQKYTRSKHTDVTFTAYNRKDVD